MKKILLLVFCFITLSANAVNLSGGVSENVINKGFFGTWHVTSKLVETNSTSDMAKLSVHIWNLSGSANVLVLENQFSGARSEIVVDKAADNVDGALLKFKRVVTQGSGDNKIVLTETPEITLKGDIFQGYDTFYIEKYKDGVPYKKEMVKYKLVGQRITGNKVE